MTIEQALLQKQIRHSRNYQLSLSRAEELRQNIPRLIEIDNELARFPHRLLMLPKGDGRGEALADLRHSIDTLAKKRRQLIADAGFDPDYDAVKHDCKKCSDTGYSDGEICDCVRQILANDRYNNGGIGSLLLSMTFDTFSLKYYKGDDLEMMQTVFSACKKYADTFGSGSKSLLLMGGTGLGKTHLSSAIAQKVIARGFDAYYESAPQFFANHDAVRFGKLDRSALEPYNCMLLLIDDLGAESPSNQTSATLFETVNRRMLAGKPTVISTNLSPSEIKKRYDERIYSRLMGEYTILQFKGKDVRMQKIMEDA